jgi:hypothetical protein
MGFEERSGACATDDGGRFVELAAQRIRGHARSTVARP